jgi:hypothetical protein
MMTGAIVGGKSVEQAARLQSESPRLKNLPRTAQESRRKVSMKDTSLTNTPHSDHHVQYVFTSSRLSIPTPV